jgi:uncharacterized protein YcgL (UPF0745 family)
VKKNYVLIDYENVQPEAIAALGKENFSVIVFVGSKQDKVKFDVVSVLQSMGERGSYVKISDSGKNALDFHIAYYIGQLVAKEPEANLYILSKDTGFDSLLKHLKGKNVSANRVKSVADLPHGKVSASKPVPDRVSVVIANLEQSGASRPRTLKTLGSTINGWFQKSLSDKEVSAIIAELTKRGIVVVNQTKVSYVLPGGQ